MVDSRQRFTSSNPCPICGGHSRLPQGRGVRCWGFGDDEWCRCTRSEYAGQAPFRNNGYLHRLTGDCMCGTSHGGWIPPLPEIRSAPRDNENRDYAQKLWDESERIQGTIAEKYLRCRGIKIELPEYLRFHPELMHHESKSTHPALISAVTVYPDTKVTAIQRTYLTADGTGKADVVPNKMSLGYTLGGAVKLAQVESVLGIAEGVETALSVQQELGTPMWAVLGANNFENVVLPEPPLAQEIRLFVDGDSDGRDCATDASDLFSFLGRTVHVSLAPEGQDFNDVLMQEVAH